MELRLDLMNMVVDHGKMVIVGEKKEQEVIGILLIVFKVSLQDYLVHIEEVGFLIPCALIMNEMMMNFINII